MQLQMTDSGTQPFSNFVSSCPAGIFQQNSKLLATDPGRQIHASDHITQLPGNLFDHLIPKRMAIAVVDLLEQIDVSDNQAERTVSSQRPLMHGRKTPLKRPPVGDPG